MISFVMALRGLFGYVGLTACINEYVERAVAELWLCDSICAHSSG